MPNCQNSLPPRLTLLRFLYQRWFLIALALVLLVGYTQAAALKPLADAAWARSAIVAAVLFLMSLPLSLAAIGGAVRRPAPTALACLLNYGMVPLVGWAASMVLSREMALGILVATATPCTLASAAVWTRRAGGNDTIALMVTVATNLSCFLLMPMWLLLTTKTEVNIPVFGMIAKLALLVVLPMIAAQLVRQIPRVAPWTAKNKTKLGVLAQVGVLSMVGLGAVAAGLKLDSNLSALFHLDKLTMVVAVLGVHLVVLAAGLASSRALGIRREDGIAVGFAGSQKTLMVGLEVAVTYYGGLVMLPMVVYHAGQLLADTVVADRLRQRIPKQGSTDSDAV